MRSLSCASASWLGPRSGYCRGRPTEAPPAGRAAPGDRHDSAARGLPIGASSSTVAIALRHQQQRRESAPVQVDTTRGSSVEAVEADEDVHDTRVGEHDGHHRWSPAVHRKSWHEGQRGYADSGTASGSPPMRWRAPISSDAHRKPATASASGVGGCAYSRNGGMRFGTGQQPTARRCRNEADAAKSFRLRYLRFAKTTRPTEGLQLRDGSVACRLAG